MGRLLGYMASRADGLRDALHQERDALAMEPATHPNGWGVGFYQGGEVLHRKRPLRDDEPFDWQQVVRDVRSDCVLVHLRHATVGDFRTENTHPFRMRSWLFAHNGTIHRFDAVRERMLEQLPDFLRRNIRGNTDSEHLFHVILSFLHDAGGIDNLNIQPKTVISAVRSAVAMVDRLGAEVSAPPGTLNLMLTNGQHMYALRRGAPLMYVARQGLHDPLEKTGEHRIVSRRNDPSALRYVLVVSDGAAVPPSYQIVEDGTVCTIDRELNVTQHRL